MNTLRRKTRQKTWAMGGGLLCSMLLFSAIAMAETQVKSGEFWEVKISTVQKSGKTTATITVSGKNGYKPNKDYPWKLILKSGPGIDSEKVLKKGDAKKFDSKVVVFEVTTDAAPSGKVSADLKMSLCDATQCKQELVSLSWS